MSADQLRAQLIEAGEKLAAADVQRADALARVKAALKAAQGELTIKEAAGLVGVTRVTAYRLLED